MSNHKFKVGDSVKCIDASGTYEVLALYTVYKIVSISVTGGLELLGVPFPNRCKLRWFSETRFAEYIEDMEYEEILKAQEVYDNVKI